MSDTSKTIRNFQCRDSLWERFEQMARELECSVDYLINDAMKQYARQRGYGGGSVALPASRSAQPPAASSPQVSAPPPHYVAPPPAAPPPVYAAPGAPPPPPPGYGSSVSPPTVSRGAPPPPAFAPQAPPAPPVINYSGAPPPPPPGYGAPPPPPPPGRATAPAPQRSPAPPKRDMHVYYGGERFTVNKERYIIGRGKSSSDLTIKDPNVSRQHAMVEFSDGRYYMVDMGSTNGVEFGGRRVQRQLINDGDVFRVCDHELRFTYN